MSNHFCKVGKTRRNLNKSFKFNARKQNTVQSIDVVYSKRPPKGFDVTS